MEGCVKGKIILTCANAFLVLQEEIAKVNFGTNVSKNKPNRRCCLRIIGIFRVCCFCFCCCFCSFCFCFVVVLFLFIYFILFYSGGTLLQPAMFEQWILCEFRGWIPMRMRHGIPRAELSR